MDTERPELVSRFPSMDHRPRTSAGTGRAADYVPASPTPHCWRDAGPPALAAPREVKGQAAMQVAQSAPFSTQKE